MSSVAPVREYVVRLEQVPGRAVVVRLTDPFYWDDITIIRATIQRHVDRVYLTGWRPAWFELRAERRGE